jgi:hypothetical protein
MKFVAVRDLRSRTAAIRKELATERDMVLTANGQPFAILASVPPDRVEENLLAIRRARALMAMDRLQDWARSQGLDQMTMDDVDALIAKVRREKRARERRTR